MKQSRVSVLSVFAVVLAVLCLSAVVFAGSANIQFNQVPSGMKKPGVYVEQDLSLAARSLPSMERKVLVIGQRLDARVEPRIWQGGTLNDMTSSGSYNGTTIKQYRVKIASVGAPDQYQFSTDNGATWSVAASLSATPVELSNGAMVNWGSVNDHAVGDEWRFKAYPAGTTAEAVPTQVFSDSQAAAAFGAGSTAHLMARAAMQANPYVSLTVVGLNDAASNGVAASGTVTIANSATGSGSVRLYVGDQYADAVIASGDTPTRIATNLSNAIAAKSDMPVTASNTTGTITLTAKNEGLSGNEIGLGYELTPGIATTVTLSQMSSGAVNPDIQTALTSVYASRYHLIVTPFNNQTDLGALKTHVETVSNALEQRGSVGIYATTGTLSGATTLAGQINSQRIVSAYVRYTSGTSQRRTPSWNLAAMTAATIAADPDISGPVKNLNLSIAAPAIADRLSRSEQEAALGAGVGPIEVGPGEAPRLVRLPLTYTLDTNNQTVFVDVHKVFGLDYVRDAAISAISAKAPKKIVREGGLTTAQILRNIVLDVAYRCQQAGVLTGVTSYKNQFLVEEDLQNTGQMNILMPSPVADGLYVVAVKQVLY